MAEKSDIIEMGTCEGRSSKLLGISMLLLSVLLVGSVTAVVFLAVNNTNPACASEEKSTTIEATVNIATDTGKSEEKVAYSPDEHVAYFYGADGEFDMDDYRKGIHVYRNSDDSVCYIIPVGANQTIDRSMKGFLNEWDGKEINVGKFEVSVEIFDEKLSDISFLTERVHDECTSGYKWMAIVSKESGDGQIMKRQVAYGCLIHCYIDSYGNIWGCHYHCYY